MRLWMATTLLVCASSGSGGCGSGGSSGPDVRTLTRDDVTGLAAGNASGSAFSGLYRVTQNQIEACHCRTGSCTGLTANVGRITQVTQTDGWLQLVDQATSALAEGGVNTDGSFQIAYLNEDPQNTQFALTAGSFTLAGGTPTSLSMVQEATGMTGGLDCDVRTSAVATYVGPLTAAFAD